MEFLQKKLKFVYGIVLFISLMPFISPAIALVIGLVFSFLGLKNASLTQHSSFILKASVVLMGFGMNLNQVISTSKSGFIDTAVSVCFVMLAGFLLGKFLKVDTKTSLLISSGTAICGGSAIAAVAPVINARNYQISFALVVIFVLNGIALIVFPLIGNYFNMSQETFGYWAAIAIHDTSSVVGAGASYGPHALEVATTVKLVRTLWIIPLSLVLAFFQHEKSKGKVQIPWFIALFISSMLLANFVPQWQSTFAHFNWLGHKGMVVALFLIGAGISVNEVKKAGSRSFLLGIALWILIGVSSFVALTY
jgi:uncharacterized integral membrane protein (TIGR00698 family)